MGENAEILVAGWISSRGQSLRASWQELHAGIPQPRVILIQYLSEEKVLVLKMQLVDVPESFFFYLIF